MNRLARSSASIFLAIVAGVTGASADPSALVQTATARQGKLAPEIVAYGTVAADPDFVTSVVVAHEAIVDSIRVRVGETVSQGTALATLTTSPAAAAQFEQAASTARFAAQDVAHARQLYAEQLATKSQLAQAEKADADAKAMLEQQQRIGADRSVTTLKSPDAGVVTDVSATRGQHVTADTTIISLGLRDRLIVNLGLEPGDAAAAPPGAAAMLVAAQDPALSFMGPLAATSAVLDPQTRLVNATVRVPQALARRLLVGMTFVGHIRLAPRDGVIIPHAALQADQDGTFVFVVAHGIAHRRSVSAAFETAKEALIPAHLANGERVVVKGSAGLEDGMAVRAN
jgi:membrane fusion protein (multidrug efflux system)